MQQDKEQSSENNKGWRKSRRADDEEDYFFDSGGLVVLTEKYLLERGYCCGNGCINCPYNYKAVPEPRRSLLLAKRQKRNEG